MSAEHIEDEQLQQYFDGELSKKPAALVERHLSGCESCTERQTSLVQLSRMIGIAAEDMARDVNFENLYYRVKQGVKQKEAPGLTEQITVWWDEFVEHQSQVWMPATGAIAVAAAVLLTLYLPGTPMDDVPVEGSTAERVHTPAEGPTAIPPEPPASTEITDVDFGDNAGTVFAIALAEGVSNQVIWIDDEDFE